MTKSEFETFIFDEAEKSFQLLDESIDRTRAVTMACMVLLAMCKAADTDFPGLYQKLFETAE